MNGEQLLNKLTKLSDIETIKDVKALTAALFPGAHCPLMGAAMAVRGIQDAMLMIIGTEECSYYTKHMTIYSKEFGGLHGRCVSVVLDDHDVTFGSHKKLEAAFKEMMEEYSPKAVYLVSTCVVEIIGDDIDSMADMLTEEYHVPVMAVHTEHFKCENHIPGLERTITASLELMQPCPCNGSVNILGQRMGNFESTELCQLLKEAKIPIGLQLPCGCDVEEIKQGAAAKVNIVVNTIALPLAKKMKQKFGIPYVFFNKYTSPKRIKKAYQDLFEYLELPLDIKMQNLYQETEERMREAREKLKGITYIYGNTPLDCFEVNEFMASLGMIPEVIQVSSIHEMDAEYIENILKERNPYITKSANISPMQYVYDVVKPHLYLGHEYAARLRKKGIAIVHIDKVNSKLGFEVTDYFIEELLCAAKEAKNLREEQIK